MKIKVSRYTAAITVVWSREAIEQELVWSYTAHQHRVRPSFRIFGLEWV